MAKCGGDSSSVIVRWQCTYQKAGRCRVDIADTVRIPAGV